MNNKEMSDLTASLITAGGIGTMLWIAGLPVVLTVGIGVFAVGGLVGISIKNNIKKGE